MNDTIRFICKCGVRSPQPILCTKDGCLTPVLINGGSPSGRRH